MLNESPQDTPISQATRLSDVGVGRIVRIGSVEVGHDGSRLEELGLTPGGQLRVIRNSDPFLCQVGHARIGFSRALATEIFVHDCHI